MGYYWVTDSQGENFILTPQPSLPSSGNKTSQTGDGIYPRGRQTNRPRISWTKHLKSTLLECAKATGWPENPRLNGKLLKQHLDNANPLYAFLAEQNLRDQVRRLKIYMRRDAGNNLPSAGQIPLQEPQVRTAADPKLQMDVRVNLSKINVKSPHATTKISAGLHQEPDVASFATNFEKDTSDDSMFLLFGSIYTEIFSLPYNQRPVKQSFKSFPKHDIDKLNEIISTYLTADCSLHVINCCVYAAARTLEELHADKINEKNDISRKPKHKNRFEIKITETRRYISWLELCLSLRKRGKPMTKKQKSIWKKLKLKFKTTKEVILNNTLDSLKAKVKV